MGGCTLATIPAYPCLGRAYYSAALLPMKWVVAVKPSMLPYRTLCIEIIYAQNECTPAPNPYSVRIPSLQSWKFAGNLVWKRQNTSLFFHLVSASRSRSRSYAHPSTSMVTSEVHNECLGNSLTPTFILATFWCLGLFVLRDQSDGVACAKLMDWLTPSGCCKNLCKRCGGREGCIQCANHHFGKAAMAVTFHASIHQFFVVVSGA